MTTISQFLRNNALRYPDRTAVQFEDVRLTFREFDNQTDRLSNALVGAGLRKGDRVAVLAPNSHRYALLHCALARIGLVLVPVNVLLTPPEVRYLVEDARPRAFIADQTFAQVLGDLLQQTDCIEVTIVIGGGVPGALDFDEILASASDGDPEIDVEGDDLRAILYTSGTTALPKGCLVTHRQVITSMSNFLLEVPIPREDPTLLIAPLFTGVGAYMCNMGILIGFPQIVMPRFDPAAILDLVEREKIAHFFGVPTMIMALAMTQQQKPRDLSSLKLVGYGGSTIAPNQIERAMTALGCEFYQFFGATETGGLISVLTPEDHRVGDDETKRKRLASCGRAVGFARVDAFDDDDNPVAPGEMGELVVQCDGNISGYLNKPEETAELFRNGWLHIGEIVRRDEDGYVYVVDRKKDMIRSGGMSVAPAEVEGVLHQHPAVAQAAVIGVPDEHYTEAVKAVVKLRDDATASEEELIGFVRDKLAGYKTPKSVDFVDAMPVNPTGKILKRELRAPYWPASG